MRMYDLIMKKRSGCKLSEEEIRYFVDGYTRDEIPDYQMAAFLMAIYFQGMNAQETAALTMAMADSGDRLDLSAIDGVKADKHSTGGVGDKTSLVLAPMVAALGVPVAKMSGRGLGHTGGTIDKLEVIPGFTTAMETEQFIRQVNAIGIALTGQTGNLAPADKKIYALRDVTATVDSMPLIASSIMSKKIAAGAEVIVLDVKQGSGAFMKTEKDARALAEEMVAIGKSVNRKTVAVISDMEQPLGCAVGNTLEMIEAIDTLKGKGSREVLELSVELGAHMVLGAGKAESIGEAKQKLYQTVDSGTALAKFKEWIAAQGGDTNVIEDYGLLGHAKYEYPVCADQDGYVQAIAADKIGTVSMLLGSGREKKGDAIEPDVGIILHKKTADAVANNECIATVYANDKKKAEKAVAMVKGAYAVSSVPVPVPKLIKSVIGN